jgi:hypothetical protein
LPPSSGSKCNHARNQHPACFTLVSCLLYFSTLKLEVTHSSEKSIDFQHTIRCYSQKTDLFTTASVRTSNRTQCTVTYRSAHCCYMFLHCLLLLTPRLPCCTAHVTHGHAHTHTHYKPIQINYLHAAAPIPDEGTGYFSIDLTLPVALWSTHPLTEMSTKNLPGNKGRPARKADSLTAICEPIVYKMWEPRSLTTLWASTACCKDSFTFLGRIVTYAYFINLD